MALGAWSVLVPLLGLPLASMVVCMWGKRVAPGATRAGLHIGGGWGGGMLATQRRHRVRRLPYRCLGGRWHMSEVVPEVLLPLVLSSRVASRWSSPPGLARLP